MKLFGLFIASAFAQGDEKKVPPKTPMDRLNQLRSHITRMTVDHFDGCNKASQWEDKLTKITNRAEKAYKKSCGFFDPSLTHGGPEGSDRKRREVDDFVRYSETDGEASINGITSGIRKWAERYISDCGGQRNNNHIINHSKKWQAKLNASFEKGC